MVNVVLFYDDWRLCYCVCAFIVSMWQLFYIICSLLRSTDGCGTLFVLNVFKGRACYIVGFCFVQLNIVVQCCSSRHSSEHCLTQCLL